jgi:hypothetical protein
MVERVLIKVYQTVVLGQQRRRLLQDHDGFNEQIFGVDKQVRGREQSDKEGFGSTAVDDAT